MELHPYLFCLFFFFYIFSTSFWRQWAAFLSAWCPLSAFRSCFVVFTQHLNVLLMNLWGRKWSPGPIPLPSSILNICIMFLPAICIRVILPHNMCSKASPALLLFVHFARIMINYLANWHQFSVSFWDNFSNLYLSEFAHFI